MLPTSSALSTSNLRVRVKGEMKTEKLIRLIWGLPSNLMSPATFEIRKVQRDIGIFKTVHEENCLRIDFGSRDMTKEISGKCNNGVLHRRSLL